jgi:hypothetical protein
VGAALAAGVLACGWAAPAKASESARVTIVILPYAQHTTVADLAAAGFSPGLMSAGIGEVTAGETFEDLSAGNREPEPSDAVPGLLDSTLANAGLSRSLRVAPVPADLHRLLSRLSPGELLIAFSEPPPASNHALPIGIAGPGFDGNLTSDSTRTDGYVLSTDLAPTILRHLGLAIPDEMNGEPIRTEGTVDPGAVEDLGERLAAIPERRGPVVIACLLAWIVVAALAGAYRREWRRRAAAWAALAFAYMPLLLLAGAALEPGAIAEGLLVGLGAAALALITVARLPGWRGLAVACAITLVAYAIDVIAGSGLTRLSLLGPNPIYGVRFYGIGNELEALFAVMVPVAVGAALTGMPDRAEGARDPRAIAAFLGTAALGAIVFGAGRFGADVGAAIVLPVGAAVAVVSLPGFRGRRLLTVIAAPLAALAALALIDLVSGGNAHLTRSVLDAGGAGDLADIAQRRLNLSADDFAQAAGNPLFWALVAGIAAAIVNRRRIDAWLRPAPLVRAGFFGGCTAVAVGVLVNDSGATFLVLGSCALGASLAYAWSQA